MEFDESVPEVEVEEARRKLDEGVPMIDVREPAEYREVRIPGTQLLPLSEFLDRFEELPRDRELILQCRSGSRSALATKALRERGFQAVNLAGGILAWESAGLPVERGAENANRGRSVSGDDSLNGGDEDGDGDN